MVFIALGIGGDIDEFIANLERTMFDIMDETVSEVLLLGDMNIDILSKRSPAYRKYHDFVSRNNF